MAREGRSPTAFWEAPFPRGPLIATALAIEKPREKSSTQKARMDLGGTMTPIMMKDMNKRKRREISYDSSSNSICASSDKESST